MKINKYESAVLFNSLLQTSKKSIDTRADREISVLLQKLWNDTTHDFKEKAANIVKTRILMDIWEIYIVDDLINEMNATPLDLFVNRTFDKIEHVFNLEVDYETKSEMYPEISKEYFQLKAMIESNVNGALITAEKELSLEASLFDRVSNAVMAINNTMDGISQQLESLDIEKDPKDLSGAIALEEISEGLFVVRRQ